MKVTLDLIRENGIEYYTEEELKRMFDEGLDDTHEPYELCGMSFFASTILKSDEVAYNECFLAYLDCHYRPLDDNGDLYVWEDDYDELSDK